LSAPRRDFADLVAILHRLRSPGGCPWDAEQTHQSLRPYLVEEAYEVLEAIDAGDDAELCDELGDLLLQVVFHAELASERKAFEIRDVVEAICAKLVRRHPHVFADVKVDSSAEVERNWAAIKKAERAGRGNPESSAIDGVPRSLPALTRAHRIGEKASSVGFDWTSADDVRAKVTEELAEADEAARSGDVESLSEELGDLLFTIASWARLSGVHAEVALERALAKFDSRFRGLERDVRTGGRDVADCTASELEDAWQRVKSAARRS
jgi:tetrapyrrole methylase family protein / MazG family protein